MTDEPEVDATMPHEPDISAHTQPTPTTGDILYAWQMQVADGWNIISMTLPNGVMMPLVTTSLPMAWEAFEVVQAHANRATAQVRLASFTFNMLAVVVDPEGPT